MKRGPLASGFISYDDISDRISLRDYLAAQALAGGCWNHDPDMLPEYAAKCYQIADALLSERDKK